MCFNHFWKNCQYDTYLITNDLKPNIKNVCILSTGKEKNWKIRMLKALDKISEEYILLMLEDYFIGKSVNNEQIDKALEYIIANDIKMYRITNIPYMNGNTKEDGYILPIPKDKRYGVNLQCAIWSKKELMSIIKKIDSSPWDFEDYFLEQVKNNDNRKIEGYYVDTREIIKIYNGVLKGKYIRDTLKYFDKSNIKLQVKDRPVMTYSEMCIYGLKCRISTITSEKLKKKIKQILSIVGFKFATKN